MAQMVGHADRTLESGAVLGLAATAVVAATSPYWVYPWLMPKAVTVPGHSRDSGGAKEEPLGEECEEDTDSVEADVCSFPSETCHDMVWLRGETDFSSTTTTTTGAAAAAAVMSKSKKRDPNAFTSWASTATAATTTLLPAPARTAMKSLPTMLTMPTLTTVDAGAAGGAAGKSLGVAGAGALEATLLRVVGSSSTSITLWPEFGEESFAMVSDGFCNMVQGRRQVLLGKDVRCIDVEAHNGGGSMILTMMRIQQEQKQLQLQLQKQLQEGSQDTGSGSGSGSGGEQQASAASFPVMLVQRRLTGEFFRVVFQYFPLCISPEEYGLTGAELRFSLGLWLEVDMDDLDLAHFESEDVSATDRAMVDEIFREFKDSLEEQLSQHRVVSGAPSTSASTTPTATTTRTTTTLSSEKTPCSDEQDAPVLAPRRPTARVDTNSGGKTESEQRRVQL